MSIMRWLCAIILCGLAAGWTVSAEVQAPGNYIAAKVNDTIITGGQVDELTIEAIQPLLRTYPQRDVLQQKANAMRSEILEQLIENQLILDDFKNGGAKVPDAMVDDEIKERIRQRWHDQATLARELQAKGMTKETLRQQIREEIILNFMRHKNVGSAILISPQKIERYYATNLHAFQLGNQIKLRMIVLKSTPDDPLDEVRKRAKEISDKLDEGAAFSEMASIYASEGPERKEGGSLGWMEESKTSKGIADIAAALKPGQHSGVIGFAPETNDVYWVYFYNKTGQVTLARQYADKVGMNKMVEEKKFETPVEESSLPAAPREFRLMLVEDKRVARTETLAEVRDRIEKELQNQERERLRKRWMERLRAKAFVRLYQ